MPRSHGARVFLARQTTSALALWVVATNCPYHRVHYCQRSISFLRLGVADQAAVTEAGSEGTFFCRCCGTLPFAARLLGPCGVSRSRQGVHAARRRRVPRRCYSQTHTSLSLSLSRLINLTPSPSYRMSSQSDETISPADSYPSPPHAPQRSSTSSSTSQAHAARARTRTRSKSGCLTCRLRKKVCYNMPIHRYFLNPSLTLAQRCDETRPVCAMCTRLGLECLGFSAQRPDWMRKQEVVTGVVARM